MARWKGGPYFSKISGVRPYGRPGKFEGGLLVDQYVSTLDMDESTGDSDTIGWYGLLKGDLSEPVWNAAKEAGEELTREEVDFIKAQAGAIVYEDSNGFVSVSWFDTETELDEEWKGVIDDIGPDEDEEDEEDFED